MDDDERKALKAEIARRVQAGEPLDRQFIWRISQLADNDGADLTEHLEWFAEIENALSLPGLELVLLGPEVGEECSRGYLEEDGKIVLTGYLHDPVARQVVVKFSRELFLGDRWARHILLEVEPEYRGKGICLQLLRQSFLLYDELGLRVVQVDASLFTGRWFWARVGFEFTADKELRKVRRWAKKVCEALGVELNVEDYGSAAQFARMGGNRRLSLAEIATALPNERKNWGLIATCNGFALDERVEFARAVMLSGPEWEGYLPLSGPRRLAFEFAVDGKARRLRRAAEEE